MSTATVVSYRTSLRCGELDSGAVSWCCLVQRQNVGPPAILGSIQTSAGRRRVHRRVADLFDRGVEVGVEPLVGLPLGQPVEQGTGEASDHARLTGEQRACLVAAVAAGERKHPQHARIRGQTGVLAQPVGIVSFSMILASGGSATTCRSRWLRSSDSASSLCGLVMLTSGSSIGTAPAAAILLA